jgi:hypothetical protein
MMRKYANQRAAPQSSPAPARGPPSRPVTLVSPSLHPSYTERAEPRWLDPRSTLMDEADQPPQRSPPTAAYHTVVAAARATGYATGYAAPAAPAPAARAHDALGDAAYQLQEKDKLLARALSEVRTLAAQLQQERAMRGTDAQRARADAYAEFTAVLQQSGPEGLAALDPSQLGARGGGGGIHGGGAMHMVNARAALPEPSLRGNALVRDDLDARLRQTLAHMKPKANGRAQ